MATRLTRRKQFAIEEESSEGTPETLVASDVQFEVEDLSSTFENEMNERNPLRASLSPVAMLPGIQRGEITGRVELVGGGTVTTKPPVADVLRACGLAEYPAWTYPTSGITGTFIPGEQITDGGSKEGRVLGVTANNIVGFATSGTNFTSTDTIIGTTSGAEGTVNSSVVEAGYAYIPDSSDSVPSFTAGVNHDGVLHRIYGARGTATIEVEGAGRLAYLNFTLSGAASDPVDQPLFTGVTLPTTDPESFLSADLAADDTSLCVNRLSLDLGNTVAARQCSNDENGILSYRITDRRPTLSIDPEALLEADFDFYAKYNAATRFAFRARIGQSQTARVRIIAPQAMFTALPHGDRDGILTHEAELLLVGDQPEADDELIIAFA